MRSQPFDICDDALYDCADGVARLGSEVAERLPDEDAVPLECLGRVLYAWTNADGARRTEGPAGPPERQCRSGDGVVSDANDDSSDRRPDGGERREYLTTNGVLVGDGRVRARNACARLDFERALTPERFEAALASAIDGDPDADADDFDTDDSDGGDFDIDDLGADDFSADGLAERRERIARVASGIVDMAAQRSFYERSRGSVPVGEDRRYEVPIGGEIREQVARALERTLTPPEAAFVARCLPERIAARVDLVSAPTDRGEGGSSSEERSNGGPRGGRSGDEKPDGEKSDDETRDPGAPDGERPDADVWLSPPPGLTFDDVGGMDDLKADLREKVIHPLSEPEMYERYGLGVVNGILLHGPPGTGKTYVTKALAGELEYRFVDINPADVVSKWVGEAAKQIARVFDLARENQPCLIFIDELDAIAPRRDGGTHSTQSERQMLNQLLIELAEVQGERIIVVAATNKYDEVDDAIRRSGRFDERINVPPPDGQSRIEILFTHLEGRPFDASSLDREHVIERTRGYTASDMELVATNAAREALERERSTDRRGRICQADVEAAIAETEPSLASADIDTWKWAANG